MSVDKFLENVNQLLSTSGILEEYKRFFEEHPEYIDSIEGCDSYLPLDIRLYPGMKCITIGTTNVYMDELYIQNDTRYKTEYRNNKPVKTMEEVNG